MSLFRYLSPRATKLFWCKNTKNQTETVIKLYMIIVSSSLITVSDLWSLLIICYESLRIIVEAYLHLYNIFIIHAIPPQYLFLFQYKQINVIYFL